MAWSCPCAGEKGVAPGNSSEGAGQPFHFKGKAFYRILDRFIDQTGAGTDSVYGGMFKDDPGGLKLKHDRKVSSRCLVCITSADNSTCTSMCSRVRCTAAIRMCSRDHPGGVHVASHITSRG